ncbi:hypothetical protein N234_35410 [Ralstonia pickettii DTP0602]|nr:hypothetical protein N234_35410 [Ralstonia pickettii DTP0602]
MAKAERFIVRLKIASMRAIVGAADGRNLNETAELRR